MEEAHQPRLLDTKHTVCSHRSKCGQVPKRAECTVCKHDVAAL